MYTFFQKIKFFTVKNPKNNRKSIISYGIYDFGRKLIDVRSSLTSDAGVPVMGEKRDKRQAGRICYTAGKYGCTQHKPRGRVHTG
jgi:hypothetical protein